MQHLAGMRGNTRSTRREATELDSPLIYHLTNNNPPCLREMNHNGGASKDHPELDPKPLDETLTADQTQPNGYRAYQYLPRKQRAFLSSGPHPLSLRPSPAGL